MERDAGGRRGPGGPDSHGGLGGIIGGVAGWMESLRAAYPQPGHGTGVHGGLGGGRGCALMDHGDLGPIFSPPGQAQILEPGDASGRAHSPAPPCTAAHRRPGPRILDIDPTPTCPIPSPRARPGPRQWTPDPASPSVCCLLPLATYPKSGPCPTPSSCPIPSRRLPTEVADVSDSGLHGKAGRSRVLPNPTLTRLVPGHVFPAFYSSTSLCQHSQAIASSLGHPDLSSLWL